MLATDFGIGAQVYPKNNNRRPKLLEQLQDMLAHKTCAAEMIVDANLVPGQRNPDAAVCLKLDVYREIFEAFIDGFAAYRSLLTQVKDAYDTALQQGLQCALENMDLRSELAAAANVQAQAVSLARSESAAEAAASKLHLQTKSNAELAKAEVAHLKELEQHLQQALHTEAEWWTKPTASFVGATLVGSQQKD
ncbi:TPA: hypothetical protein ACH3X1_012023 [Trebouxia sp. C0004]